jgi:hypothetical protein
MAREQLSKKQSLRACHSLEKLIRAALVNLHHATKRQGMTSGGCLKPFVKKMRSKFDFKDGMDFVIREWKRAVNEYGPGVKAKVYDKKTGIHLRVKTTKTNLATFVLLSSSKNNQPVKPTKGKTWTQALELLEAIMDSI